MSHQFDLFHTGVEITRLPTPDCPKATNPPVGRTRPPRKTPARNTKIAAEHQARRGDLFREQFEMRRNIVFAQKPDSRTFEDTRAELYWALHWGSKFSGRRRIKGPMEHLKHKVGRDRCAEFDVSCDDWAQRAALHHDVESSFAFLMTKSFTSEFGPARQARAQLAKAQLM